MAGILVILLIVLIVTTVLLVSSTHATTSVVPSLVLVEVFLLEIVITRTAWVTMRHGRILGLVLLVHLRGTSSLMVHVLVILHVGSTSTHRVVVRALVELVSLVAKRTASTTHA
jgi:hypothetical protein